MTTIDAAGVAAGAARHGLFFLELIEEPDVVELREALRLAVHGLEDYVADELADTHEELVDVELVLIDQADIPY